MTGSHRNRGRAFRGRHRQPKLSTLLFPRLNVTDCPSPRRAIVLAADRWHVDFMGVYGNDWIETPALQRLAAEGVVFDAHFAATLDPSHAASAWWSGQVPGGRAAGGVAGATQRDDFAVIDRLNAAGVHTVLLVENPQERPAVVLPPFREVISVEATDELDAPESQMPWARMVRCAEEWLQANADRPGAVVLWLWTRGVPVPWLPPREFADLYLEDFGLALPEPEGPAPAAGLTPEPLLLPEEVEPEEGGELVAWAEEEDLTTDQERIPEEVRFALALYASYASVLDRWLGRLLRSVEARPAWREGVLVFTSAMGQAIFQPPGSPRAGELFPEDAPPPGRGEMLQTPLIVRLPARATRDSAALAGGTPSESGGEKSAGQHAEAGPTESGGAASEATAATREDSIAAQRGTRRGGLVSTIDLGPTLCDWFGVESGPGWSGRSVWPLIEQTSEQVHAELLTSLAEGGWALRTPDHLLVDERSPEAAGGGTPRLYEKPVDRWDVADVAREQPQVVDELEQRLRELRHQIQQAGEGRG